MGASNKVCIKDGVVVNIIYAEDDFVSLLIQTGKFDVVLDQSNFPQPADIGYLYDGKNVAPPPPVELDPQTMFEIKIQRAILGFNDMMIKYVASNVILGITQQGKTQLIADTLKDVQRYGQSGSLYAAISALQRIPLTPEMDPFLNQKVINDLIAQTQNVLANL